jgi:hypothetical protein
MTSACRSTTCYRVGLHPLEAGWTPLQAFVLVVKRWAGD